MIFGFLLLKGIVSKYIQTWYLCFSKTQSLHKCHFLKIVLESTIWFCILLWRLWIPMHEKIMYISYWPNNMYVLHISMSGIDQGHSFTSLWRNCLQKELALQLFVHLNDCSRKHLWLSVYSTSMSIWNDWLNNTYKNLFQEPILETFSQQNQYIQHPKSKLRIKKHFELKQILGNTLGI